MKPPYTDLFIYCLDGRLSEEPRPLPEEWIGCWHEGDQSFLFFSAPSQSVVDGLLEKSPHCRFSDAWVQTYAEWLGGLPETRVAGPFTIVPDWEWPDGEEPSFRRLRLDPGIVFGAGNHPTTQDVLELMQRIDMAALSGFVADLGSGTGILSVAAARLGAARVLAVDINRPSVEATRRNCLLNRVEDVVRVVQGRAETVQLQPEGAVLANLPPVVLAPLIRSEAFLGSRYFILSGMTVSAADTIRQELGRLPVTLHEVKESGIWRTFFGECKR